MRIKTLVLLGVVTMLAGTGLAMTQATKHTSAKKSSHHRKARRGAWKRKGQQVILPDRAREIQEALIREKYLEGTPSGKWDTRSQAAMSRYQADHGWQSKVTPDSRALIKLGLGPNYNQNSASLSGNSLAPGRSSAPNASQNKR